jgi:hypothetical protein
MGLPEIRDRLNSASHDITGTQLDGMFGGTSEDAVFRYATAPARAQPVMSGYRGYRSGNERGDRTALNDSASEADVFREIMK